MAIHSEKTTTVRRITTRSLLIIATTLAALGFTAGAQAGAMFSAQAEALAEITSVQLATGEILEEADIFDAISTTATRTGSSNTATLGAGNAATAGFDGTDDVDIRVFEVSAIASGTTVVPGSADASATATVTVVITVDPAVVGAVTVNLEFANGIGSSLALSLDTALDSTAGVGASTSCAAAGPQCTTGASFAAQIGPILPGTLTAPQPSNLISPLIGGTGPSTFEFTMSASASGSVATAPPAQVPEPGVLALMTLGLLWAGGRTHRQRRR